MQILDDQNPGYDCPPDYRKKGAQEFMINFNENIDNIKAPNALVQGARVSDNFPLSCLIK